MDREDLLLRHLDTIGIHLQRIASQLERIANASDKKTDTRKETP